MVASGDTVTSPSTVARHQYVTSVFGVTWSSEVSHTYVAVPLVAATGATIATSLPGVRVSSSRRSGADPWISTENRTSSP